MAEKRVAVVVATVEVGTVEVGTVAVTRVMASMEATKVGKAAEVEMASKVVMTAEKEVASKVAATVTAEEAAEEAAIVACPAAFRAGKPEMAMKVGLVEAVGTMTAVVVVM